MMRVRRETAIGAVDTPAIEELAAWGDSDEHRRFTLLSDADGRGSLRSSLRHGVLLAGARPCVSRPSRETATRCRTRAGAESREAHCETDGLQSAERSRF